MGIIRLISNKAELILSAIGVTISALALIQGSIQKNNGKNPVIFHIVAAVSICFVLFVIASAFVHHFAGGEYGVSVQIQTQADTSGNISDTLHESSTKRIVLTSCVIDQGRIEGTYTFEGFDEDILVYQGDLYCISGESHWLAISEKLSFSYEDSVQTFTFLINEPLLDGNYACEFRCMTQKETFIIEIHFQVKDACYYGTSCNELYSDGTSNIFTDTKALFDHGL